MTKNRMTKAWLKNHISYCWWKYLLMAVLCVVGVDVLFAVTQYRPPEEKKVEIYVLNDYAETEAMSQELEPLFFERCPDQEELTVLNINLGSDDMYARMQFTTYAAAKQGDVYMLPAGELLALTQESVDAFVDLKPYIESGVIDVRGIDVSSGVMRRADGSEGVYAIPADTLYGMFAYGNDPAGSMLCMPAFGGNDAHAAQAIDLLIEQYHVEKLENIDQMRGNQQKQTVLF